MELSKKEVKKTKKLNDSLHAKIYKHIESFNSDLMHNMDEAQQLLCDISELKFQGYNAKVNSNYDFTNTPVAGKVHKNIVIKKGKLKIGITGCGVELVGLVPDKLFTNTKYLDPIKSVQEQVDILKFEKKCHFIICLSHLGYKYDDNKISDIVLSNKTKHIDLIIGGHTHTFLEAPTKEKNSEGKDVLINQVGWAGVQIGQLDYFFEKSFSKNLRNSQTVIVDKKSSEK